MRRLDGTGQVELRLLFEPSAVVPSLWIMCLLATVLCLVPEESTCQLRMGAGRCIGRSGYRANLMKQRQWEVRVETSVKREVTTT